MVAAVLGVLFVWHERRDRDPMLDLGLFRNARFSTGIASGVGSYLVMFGVLLLVPFYLERGLGLGTARSGLELMAMPLAFGVVAPLAGRLADRVGARPLHRRAGWRWWPCGLVLLGALRPATAGFLVLLAVVGVGMGLFTSPNNASIMGAAPGPAGGDGLGRPQHDAGHGDGAGPGGDGHASSSWPAEATAGRRPAPSTRSGDRLRAGRDRGGGRRGRRRCAPNGTLANATLSSVE